MGVCSRDGHWWLCRSSDLDARVQVYVPTHDGFLTAMHHLEVGCGTELQATKRLGRPRAILAVCGLVALNPKVT